MFQVSEAYKRDQRILTCEYIGFPPLRISAINTATAITQTKFNLPREDSVNSLLNRYFDLNFDVVQAGTNKKLVNLGPIVLFKFYMLTTSSGKQLEYFSNAHVASFL